MELSSFGTECNICREEYEPEQNDPLNLPCGHTFCSRCLNRLVQRACGSGSYEISCPECREQIPVNEQTKFRRNFALVRALTDRDATRNNALENLRRKSLVEPDLLKAFDRSISELQRNSECSSCDENGDLTLSIARRALVSVLLAAIVVLFLIGVVYLVRHSRRSPPLPADCIRVRFRNRGVLELWGGYLDCVGGQFSWTSALLLDQTEERWAKWDEVVKVNVSEGSPPQRSYMPAGQDTLIVCEGIAFDWKCELSNQTAPES